MGALDRLPTLADLSRRPRAIPKHELRTRLTDKAQADRDDVRKLEQFRRAVAHRDRNRCRVCGCRTIVTLALVKNRREVHHLRSRTDPLVRHDPKNGIVVCAEHHGMLTHHQLFAVQPAADMFTAGRTKKKYLDANKLSLIFVAKNPEGRP